MRPLQAIIITFVCFAIVSGTADAWYPAAVLEEMGTSTTCVYCPDAYEGIELNKIWFDTNEFNAIHYYDPPLLTNQDAQDRIDFYNMVGYPNLYFQGQSHIIGTDDQPASGLTYKARIQEYLIHPSYFKMTMNLADFDLGVVDFDIEVMEDGPDISNMVVQIAIVEDDIYESHHYHHNVLRDLLNETQITVSTLGQIQNINEIFTVDPTWVVENLRVVAFIQDNVTRVIETSVSSLAKPQYAARFYALGNRQVMRNLYESSGFENFVVYNAGTETDNFTIQIVRTGGNEDYMLTICDEALCYGETYTEELLPGEHLELHADIISVSSGWAQAEIRISQENGEPGKYGVIDYGYVTGDVTVLYIDGDGFDNHEDYYTTALDHCQENYGVWNRRLGPLDFSLEFPYFGPTTMIWGAGVNEEPLTADDRDFITALQVAEGNLLISGQDIAEQMETLGGAAYTWYQTALHADFINDDTDVFTLNGVEGDPVSTQLSISITGGDGADNQNSPDQIAPLGASATTVWKYSDVMFGGIRADTGLNRVVNMAFGFEAIDGEIYRYMVMHDALKWLKTGDMAIDEPAFARTSLSAPSVMRGNTAINFTLPAASDARLTIFGLDGRVINTLISGEMGAGTHASIWNGTDNSGNAVSAGVYYYRLQTDTEQLVRKAVLLR